MIHLLKFDFAKSRIFEKKMGHMEDVTWML